MFEEDSFFVKIIFKELMFGQDNERLVCSVGDEVCFVWKYLSGKKVILSYLNSLTSGVILERGRLLNYLHNCSTKIKRNMSTNMILELLRFQGFTLRGFLEFLMINVLFDLK